MNARDPDGSAKSTAERQKKSGKEQADCQSISNSRRSLKADEIFAASTSATAMQRLLDTTRLNMLVQAIGEECMIISKCLTIASFWFVILWFSDFMQLSYRRLLVGSGLLRNIMVSFAAASHATVQLGLMFNATGTRPASLDGLAWAHSLKSDIFSRDRCGFRFHQLDDGRVVLASRG